MLVTAFTLFFALSALAAVATMASALRTYGVDVAALRTRHRRGEAGYVVTWRLVETGSRAQVRDAARVAEQRRPAAVLPTRLAA